MEEEAWKYSDERAGDDEVQMRQLWGRQMRTNLKAGRRVGDWGRGFVSVLG